MMDDNQTPAPLPEASTWYLKIDDGSVFGPVETETLRLWAQQGRVAPGNAISINETDWYPAEEFEELEMRWLVGLSNGTTYGPINIRALEELINSGAATPDATLEDVRTGEKRTPREKRDAIFFGGAVPPEFDQEMEQEEPEVEPEVSEDVGHVVREIATASAEDEGGETLDHHSLDEKISQFESTLKRTMTLLRAHQRELEREKEHNQEIRDELESREGELGSVRAELAEVRERHAQEQRESTEAAEALTRREEAIRSSAETIETLRKQLEDEQEESRKLAAQCSQRESAVTEELNREKAKGEALAAQAASTKEELNRKASELAGIQSQVEEAKRLSEGEIQRAQALKSEIASVREELVKEKTAGSEFSNALRAKEAEFEGIRKEAEQRALALQAELADVEQNAEVQGGQLEAARKEVVSLQEQSEERERALLEQVNSLKEDVRTATTTLETLKVDLRKAQEGALDAQKVRQRVKDLSEQNAALRERLESRQEASAKQFEHAKQKIDDLQREVEDFEKTEVVTPELVDEEDGSGDGNSSPSPLEDLEAQAQRELRAWQRSRNR